MVKRGLIIVVGASFLVAVACGEDFQSNPGGGGQAQQSCVSIPDCEIPADACTTVSCQNNTCIYTQGQDNVPLPEDDQVIGDCQVTVCIGGGSVDKPSNDAPASDDCKSFTCNDGVAIQQNAMTGTACGDGGTLDCDGQGNCVGCQTTEECPTSADPCKPFTCEGEICVQKTMTNVALPDNRSGDCKRPGCNGDGNQVSHNDDSDVPNDGDPDDCVAPSCAAGMVVEDILDVGAVCTSPLVGACCGEVCCTGACVEGSCQGLGGAGGMGGVGGGGGAGGDGGA